jgi:hypothetical protein
VKKFTTLQEVKDHLELNPLPELTNLNHGERMQMESFHLGSIDMTDWRNAVSKEDSQSKLGYEMISHFFTDIMPPLKLLKWEDLETLRRSKKLLGFNGLRFPANAYHRFMPDIYTSGIQPAGEINITTKFQVATVDDEIKDIADYCGEEREAGDFETEQFPVSLNSMYYHSAKAHWLIQSIREEGLWAPIQGFTKVAGENQVQLAIHPGSVRSGVFEEMEDPSHELLIWDFQDSFPDATALTADQTLDYWSSKINDGAHKCLHDNMSMIFTHGTIEFQSDHSNIEFRRDVWEHSKKVSTLTCGKPLTIYLGYDSRHGDLAKIAKEAVKREIENSVGFGQYVEYTKFTPVVKLLDVADIPEYTREYANQSTEFTYSRFLIPYLENYEGFSIFADDDFIFTKSVLPMFYYLNTDDAVACIKYPHYEHDATKFDGEVNIDYPCKLWSSLMIFNNGHEDCKKLTPDAVNTWTGKQLHQFEWTDKISEIPQKYVFVEGYDDPEVKWDYTAIHYTRGGPWVKDMTLDHINNLENYHNAKRLLTL